MGLSTIEYWLNRLPDRLEMPDGVYWLTIQRKDEEWAVYYKGENFVRIYTSDKDLGLAFIDIYCKLIEEGYSEEDYDD
jgi:hypothetical protein